MGRRLKTACAMRISTAQQGGLTSLACVAPQAQAAHLLGQTVRHGASARKVFSLRMVAMFLKMLMASQPVKGVILAKQRSITMRSVRQYVKIVQLKVKSRQALTGPHCQTATHLAPCAVPTQLTSVQAAYAMLDFWVTDPSAKNAPKTRIQTRWDAQSIAASARPGAQRQRAA